jgi:hypothetical protein
MDIIKNYQKDARDCATVFSIYLSKLEFSGFSGVEPILTNTIQKYLKFILEDIDISKA